MTSSAAELSSAARAADGVDIADKPCAAVAAQENDFAMMIHGPYRGNGPHHSCPADPPQNQNGRYRAGGEFNRRFRRTDTPSIPPVRSV